jgi:hypothetical protein
VSATDPETTKRWLDLFGYGVVTFAFKGKNSPEGGKGPRPVVSAMKKIFGFGAKERTPLGFCDGRRASQGPGHGGADSRYWHRFYAKRKTDAKIHRAASAGRVEEVKALLSSGKWSVDARDKKNR